MGNDHSRLKGLEIDKNAVEANDFWALFDAESPTTSNDDGRQLLSIFQGEPVVSGQLWSAMSPMERVIKNLKIYRHPYILKYVTTWEKGGQKHLATERVEPLAPVLSAQSDIQVCLGLRTILCSLIFLVEKAMARHLNVCIGSIYITDNGSWRLAGFEYVWKRKDVTKALLNLVVANRYQHAIDSCELSDSNSDSIEQYAFATLCEEILGQSARRKTATPHVQEFREYCATHLKHKNAQLRPKLSAVLLHPYFNHEFVLIHSFLFELPLKSVQEKQDFFTGLIDRLRYFNEEVVGAQLAADLLSRMVLLDPTAQLCVTPYVLRTKSDHSAALFSTTTYMRYLMPHILKMFRLRDAQIRLILLEYFMEYVRLLEKSALLEAILPHLHAGMNDTNDVLVAKTMRCLADLVPILGAATVIGGPRSRLFSDGRPQAAVSDCAAHWVEPRSITPVMGGHGGLDVDFMVSDSPMLNASERSGSNSSSSLALTFAVEQEPEMPPRLSPDGGEDDKSSVVIADGISEAQAIAGSVLEALVTSVTVTATATTTELSVPPTATNGQHVSATEEEEEAWSDWETDELQRLNDVSAVGEGKAAAQLTTPTTPLNSKQSTLPTQHSASNAIVAPPAPAIINDDLNALDIQVQKSAAAQRNDGDEFDFFKDMVPVIKESNWHSLSSLASSIQSGQLTTTPTTNSVPNGEKEVEQEEEKILIDTNRFAADAGGYAVGDDNAWGMDDDDVDVNVDVDAAVDDFAVTDAVPATPTATTA